MVFRTLRLVLDVMDEWPFERRSCRVPQHTCKGAQYRQVRRALEIQHPTGLFGLVVLVKPDFLQGLEDLAPAVVNSVRLAHESNDDGRGPLPRSVLPLSDLRRMT